MVFFCYQLPNSRLRLRRYNRVRGPLEARAAMSNEEIQEYINWLHYRVTLQLFPTEEQEEQARKFLEAFRWILAQRRKHERMLRRKRYNRA